MVLVVGMMSSQVGFRLASAAYARLKSVTTEPRTGALTAPKIEHPVLVIEVKVDPTSPLMVDPGPVLVQVTVPTVGDRVQSQHRVGSRRPQWGRDRHGQRRGGCRQ